MSTQVQQIYGPQYAGPGSSGGCSRPPNEYDRCLMREVSRLRRIKPLPPCSVPRELWNLVPWEEDYNSLPALGTPFRHINSILCPTTAAGNTPIVQLKTPTGYDGVLLGFFWRYNGINFVEGGGDIFWRIQVNQRYIIDLSNVGFTMGSAATPIPMTEGQLLQSGQLISVVVNVPNVSGGIQIGAATITAGLFGFLWPKGAPAWTWR